MVVSDAVETKKDRSISTWRGLLFRSAFAAVVLIVLIQILARLVIPPLVVGVILLVIGLVWLSKRSGRAPVIYLAVVSALLVLGNLPFAIPAMQHPESATDFISSGAILVALLVTAGVALAELRSRRPAGRAPRTVGLAALGLVILMAVVGVAAAVSLEDDQLAAGDLTLGSKASKWTADTLAAKAGQVAVLVDNDDATRHDFTIKDANAKVSADLPELTKRRVTFDAKPGSYEYICTIHPEMKGTLTVS